jgi:type II secretory pathway component PulF
MPECSWENSAADGKKEKKPMENEAATTSHELNWDAALAVIFFTRRFSALIDAGISLVRSLLCCQEDAPPPFALALRDIQSKIEQGYTLSRTMSENPDYFPPFYVKMVRVGEVGGFLEVALNDLMDLLEEEWKISRMMKGNSPTRLLTNRSASPGPQQWKDLNSTERKLTLALFSRSLGRLLSAGVPMRLSLETAAELLPETEREAVRSVAQADPKGGIAQSLSELGFLPLFMTEIMALGEKTVVMEGGERAYFQVAGDSLLTTYRQENVRTLLDKMLDKVADTYLHELLFELRRDTDPFE